MAIDVGPFLLVENLIENHRRKRATDAPLYLDAVRELEKRTGKGLDFDKSLVIILRAAKKERFVSHKDLANADGLAWIDIYRTIADICGSWSNTAT